MVTNFLFFIESFAGLLLVSGIAFAVFDFAVSVGEGERVSPINLLLNLFKGSVSFFAYNYPTGILIDFHKSYLQSYLSGIYKRFGNKFYCSI